MGFPSFSAWTKAFVSFLLLSNTFIPVVQASSSDTIQGTDPSGVTRTLLVDRYPSLYTKDFSDCLGGQSLVNLTSFNAAYFKDNSTVLFNMAGHTSLRNESVMLYISVEAYGENRFNKVFNPCTANYKSLCPMNASVPISGTAIIPVAPADVADIIPIALVIPDFEGSASIRIFSNSSKTEIGCFKAVMSNGNSFAQPAAVSPVLGVFTAIALISSFATAIYGVSVPNIRTHYAHSLSVLVVFEVFQSIFFSGALSLSWPSVLPAFWSNFAWSAGQIYTSSLINSVNSFTGVSGNASQVGGAGSTTLNNNGGLQLEIYGRSLDSEMGASSIYKRAVNDTKVDPRMYAWAGLPVAPGIPSPGNWSDFSGTLMDIGIPAADAFVVGLVWFLVFVVGFIAVITLLKYSLEFFSKLNWVKHDRLALFRSHWLGFLGLMVLRSLFIGFFMMMTLTMYQFSYGGKGGVIAIATLVFLIFFAGGFGTAFYACFYRVRFGKYASSPDRIHLQRKNILKVIPWFKTVRESSLGGEVDKTQYSGSFSFFRLQFVTEDAERQSVHDDAGYTKRFGWLSARYRRTRWWYFAVYLVYQFVRACFIGGARASPTAQVIGIFIWEIIALIVIARISPFEGARNTALAVYMLGISKIATAGLSIAFLPQYNVARIPTTVIGVVIIVIQGFLVIGLLILIVLGAISSWMSLTRNREEFHPQSMDSIRLKYFGNIDKKATDLPPPPPPVPEEPKEPYFSVKTVRRAPKIEDEDIDNFPDLQPVTQPSFAPVVNRASRTNSMQSHYSGGLPFGARVHRASWSSRDFQNFREEDSVRGDSPYTTPSRAPSGLGHNTANNSVSMQPLVGSQISRTSVRSSTPTQELRQQYSNQRMRHAS